MTALERNIVWMLVLSAWSWMTPWPWELDTPVLIMVVFVSTAITRVKV